MVSYITMDVGVGEVIIPGKPAILTSERIAGHIVPHSDHTYELSKAGMIRDTAI